MGQLAVVGKAEHGRRANRAWAAGVIAVALLLLYLGVGTSFDNPRRSGVGGCHPALQLQQQPSKTRIAWSHTFPSPSPPPGLTLHEAKAIATDNTGNLVWIAAAVQLMDPNMTELVDVRALDPAEPPPAAFLLPTANTLANVSRYGASVDKYGETIEAITNQFLELVRGTPAPTLLIGIGTQVFFRDGVAEEAGPEAIATPGSVTLAAAQAEFLAAVVESGGAVTVRGQFTAGVMEANGLAPPLPLGCPSLFLNHAPRLGAELQRKWDAILAAPTTSMRVAVTLPVTVPPVHLNQSGYPEEQVALLVSRVLRALPGSVVVLQTEADQRLIDDMNAKLGFYLSASRVRWYYDVDSWVAGLRSCCDMVFGFRIHGAMAGIAAGLPSVVISQDFRVRELADAMALPTASWPNLGPLHAPENTLFDILKAIGFDGAAFDERRRSHARAYQQVLEAVNVPIHPGIAAIAEDDGADVAEEI